MKTYKYKLKLTKEQSKRIDSWIGTCRYIYNLALETKIEAYRKSRISLSRFDLQSQLPALKDVEWIKDVPAQSLQLVIKRLHEAYNTFFKGGGSPSWAKKHEYKSISFTRLKFKNGVFYLPKVGAVKVFKDRMPISKIKIATVIKENNSYYLSVTFDCEPQNLYPTDESQVVGLDMGLAYFLVDSNGCFVDNPRHTLKYQKKLRVKQRSLSRKKKGSNSRAKARQEVATVHRKIKNTRSDFIHKISHQYVKENSLIVVEDLKIKNMIKFGHLAKHINDAGWYDFFTKLEYKSKLYGKTFVKINPKYTSQKCNACGHTSKDNRKSQSKFECVECGHIDNADYNASKNILGEGIALVRQREAIACA